MTKSSCLPAMARKMTATKVNITTDVVQLKENINHLPFCKASLGIYSSSQNCIQLAQHKKELLSYIEP